MPGWWRTLCLQLPYVLTSLGIENGMATVRFCRGEGFFTAPLNGMVRGMTVIGIGSEILAQARDSATASGVTNRSCILGDACHFEWPVPSLGDFVQIENIFHGGPTRPSG